MPNFLATCSIASLSLSCLVSKSAKPRPPPTNDRTEYADVFCCTGLGEFANSPSPPRKSAVSLPPSPTTAAADQNCTPVDETDGRMDADAGSELAAEQEEEAAGGPTDTKRRRRRPLYSRKCRPNDRSERANWRRPRPAG